MNQIEPFLDAENADTPTYDPVRAAKPRVKVIKTSYNDDPMRENVTFQIFGCVYICYAKKTRGRSMIRYLGLLDNGRPPGKEKEPFEDAISGDSIKDAIDQDVIGNLVKEAKGHGQS